jgi:predicted  nucleic acid-binding Zn-ribbon protein
MAGTGKVSSPIIKKEVSLAPAKARDLYSWAAQQAALLREGRTAEIDADAIAEEIDDVGEEQYHRLESALRVLLHHLLKWDYQSSARSRSWAITIREQRRRADRQLRKNPGLKARLNEALTDAYEDARDEAARETGLPTRTFPVAIPFTFSDVMERPILWPGDEA